MVRLFKLRKEVRAHVPIKVFLMDDEEKFCQIVKLNLEKTKKFQIAIECAPENFLSRILAFRPEVIVMDVLMPGLWGYDLMSRLHKDERLKNIPVLFLTALAQKGQRHIYGGLVDNLPFFAKPVYAKPIRTHSLVQAIEESLLRKKLFFENQVCARCKKEMTHVNEADILMTLDEAPRLVHQDCERQEREILVRQ